jgi:hypothetical protein
MNSNNLFLKFALLLFLSITQLIGNAQSKKVVISEFMAINDNILADEDGDYSDWMELYNPGEESVNLKGWYLTDKTDNLTKWKLPEVVLGADEYIVVFASEKKRNDPSSTLHTNFKLSGSGEFLALVESDGTTISYSYSDSYPAQRADESYGLYQEQLIFFKSPTPGSENVLSDQVLSPHFSKGRGFYESSFSVSLSTADNSLKIYYSTDGTRPTVDSGTLYQGPVNISKTTPLSAVAMNNDGVYSEIISHTYIFTDGVVAQPKNPEGFPSSWGPLKFKSENAPADYEMDPEICNSPEYKDLLNEALKEIPTLSIVTNRGFLFSHEKDRENGGIYIYTGNSGAFGMGLDWERPVSVEYFDPNSDQEFQVNCGVRMHGGNSRIPDNSPKHSLRLSFRSTYGPSKLNYRIFDEETAANEFNSLVLRAGYNHSWLTNVATARRTAQYMRDSFAKNTQLAMARPSAHERFVHLYLNGLYWGVYNVSEKLTNDFMESYLGGNEDDYDVIKDHGGTVDGNFKAWVELYNQTTAGLTSNENYQKVQGKNPDGTINPSYNKLLDVDNLIDYMLFNMYIGNIDWDHNNWIAARNRITNEAGFRFFSWDAETSMINVNENITDENNEQNPSWIYHNLQGNPDFRMLFADHIQKHFFNEGSLSPEACADRYQKLTKEIDLAIIAETARWGDYRRDIQPSDNDRVLYTKNEFWDVENQRLMNDYFPYRSDIVVQQFKKIGLFPTIDAPEFTHYTDEYSEPIDLEIFASSGNVYYTSDGSDPREGYTGNVSHNAISYQGVLRIAGNLKIKARAKFGDEWSALTEAKFNFDGVTGIPEIPTAEVETGCYPNPFKQTVTIFYTMPNDAPVVIRILSIDGRLVDQIYSGYDSQGKHEVVWTPTNSLKGVFIYQIQIDNYNYVGKIIRN